MDSLTRDGGTTAPPARRPRPVRRPRTGDIALAVGFAVAGTLAGAFYHAASWRPFDLWGHLLTVGVSLPLAWRENRPFPVLVVTSTGFTAYLLSGYQPSLNYWVPAVAFVFVAARARCRTALWGGALLAAVLALSGVCGRLPWPVVVVQALIVPAVAAAIGLALRRLAAKNVELRRLNTLLDQQQRQEARRAVLDERFRIARELHDTISQHMTIVTLQTGLAEYLLPSDPDAARKSLGDAAAAGRDALDELRRLLVVLRTHDLGDVQGPGGAEDPTAPVAEDLLAGIDRIPLLAEQLERVGVRVDVRVIGKPRRLHPGIELCAFRVVQEALTNVVKHSGARAAAVNVTYGESRLTVSVSDEGADEGADEGRRLPAASPAGTGHGLIGMRERARIWHGSLTAGPHPGGGFQVRLCIPLAPDLAGR
ncbi:sensor histidine kinase [Streptomyces sp. NPDC002734]|uniref:sensor histidine kinase n=1 Tax=Streptomyces sp. NPDC002734 TaxID=3154426 RepID=UPI00332BC9E8